MKKIFCSFLFSAAVLFSNAQIRKIPSDVTDAFATRYPHATHVEWKDKLQYFEASFELNESNLTADFSSNGDWQKSEREIEQDDLPDEVKDGFDKSKYTDWQTNGFYEIQELGKPLQYRINVQKSGIQKKNLIFDVDGKLLREIINL